VRWPLVINSRRRVKPSVLYALMYLSILFELADPEASGGRKSYIARRLEEQIGSDHVSAGLVPQLLSRHLRTMAVARTIIAG
jgi:hypothetical protein